MIFHHPLPIVEDAKSASRIRPKEMLEAFKSLGYDVFEVTGYSDQRRKRINELKLRVEAGDVYDFVYSESSTMPTILTDYDHIPRTPFLDYRFFKYCQKKGIVTSLFYRDIYWKFDCFKFDRNMIKKFAAIIAYRWDEYWYKNVLDRLYIPSTEMTSSLNEHLTKISTPLPPGHSISHIPNKIESSLGNEIRIFYVGGIGEHYKLHSLFRVANNLDRVKLTVCCRESEWDSVKSEYEVSGDIRIVHLSGQSMLDELFQHNVVSLYVEPSEYRDFAVPFKLYEYIGAAKPILATKGTLVGDFISDNNIGWVVNYDDFDLAELLEKISFEQFDVISNNLIELREKHNWKARAKQVVRELKK